MRTKIWNALIRHSTPFPGTNRPTHRIWLLVLPCFLSGGVKTVTSIPLWMILILAEAIPSSSSSLLFSVLKQMTLSADLSVHLAIVGRYIFCIGKGAVCENKPCTVITRGGEPSLFTSAHRFVERYRCEWACIISKSFLARINLNSIPGMNVLPMSFIIDLNRIIL